MGALLLLLAAACGGSSGDAAAPDSTVVEMDVPDPEAVDAELAGAQAVCEEYIDREVPEGELLLVIPQSVAEVRSTEPGAWPDKDASDRVLACSFSRPASSATTTCPDGSVIDAVGIGETGSVSLDLDGVVGWESEIVPLELCER
jgi:hypothetical protein